MRKRLYIVRREAGGIGGAEKVANRFAKSFSEYFEVELLFAGKEIHGRRLQGTRGPSWLKCLRFAKSTRQFLAKEHDALVLSMERGVSGTIYRAGDGVHKVWKRHKFAKSFRSRFNPLHYILPCLEKKSIEQSKFVVPNSNMVKQEILKNYSVSEKKLVVIHNGFDPQIFHPINHANRSEIRETLGIDSGSLCFLFSGSGWERKGLEKAFRLLHEIKRMDSKIKLYVAGKGNRSRFLSLAKGLSISDEVQFMGPVTEIAPWYQVADAMIMPTLYDPFSNSCLESLACGCPVVTTPTNGACEIITSKLNGLIINENVLSLSEWAKHILELIKRNKASSGEAFEHFKKFDNKKEVGGFMGILNSLP